MQWFIKEQVEEVATMSDLLRVVERSRTTRWRSRTTWRASTPGEEGEDPTAPHPAGAGVSFAAELREAAAPVWEAQLAHPFVRGIGDGSLPEERFRFYVRQDYLFLIDYGRLLALGAARAPRLEWMRRFAALAESVLETEMDAAPPVRRALGHHRPSSSRPSATAPATDAYCDFLLRTAALGDFAELVAALLPCMWSYAEIGRRLAAGGLPDHEGYAEWIEMYATRRVRRSSPPGAASSTDAAAAEVAGPAPARACTPRSARRASTSWRSGQSASRGA